MNRFNLFEHCKKFSNHKFIDEVTYEDFFKLIQETSISIEPTESLFISIVNEAPLEFFTKIFSIWSLNKIPILISKHETTFGKKELLKQIAFEDFKWGANQQCLSTDFNENEKKIVFFTSGSTGTPKNIVHSFSTLLQNVLAYNKYFSTSETEVYYLNLPLNHIAGFMLVFRAFLNGAKVTTKLEQDIDYISLVPMQISKIYSENNMQLKNTLSKAKAVLIGGSKINESIKDILVKHKVKFYETYGMTETASFVCLNNRPLENRDLKLNQSNQILISSPSLYIGSFINNVLMPTSLVKIDNKLYFKTEDVGVVNESNQIVFLKRSEKTFNSAGEKFSIETVYQEIKKHELFKEFYLIVIPDLKWGDLLVCFHTSNVSEDYKLILKDHLHPYSIPKHFISISDSINNENQQKLTYNFFKLEYLKHIIHYKLIFNQQNDTIIVFHGFMESIDDWIFLNQTLKHKFNFLFIDLPGHGNTLNDNFYSLEDITEKLSYLITNMNELIGHNLHLFGYSMGGRLALHLAPLLELKSLTLYSTGLGLSTSSEQANRQLADNQLFNNIKNEHDLIGFFEQWYSNDIFGNYKDTANFKNDILKKNFIHFTNWQKSLYNLSVANFPIESARIKDIEKLNIKINFAYGENDKKYANIARKLELTLCKCIKFYEIKNQYHNSHKANQELFIDLIKLIY